MTLKPEDKIISSWNYNLEKPLVSICCPTYNHELYIEDTLKGFLIQETNFPFEILIHDDASTDKTQEIIRKYEIKYPSIIKPIYQEENQYSKGKRINFNYNYSRAQGKYIAICEGDDYWTDSQKLQKQFDIMEDNPKITLCVHATSVLNMYTNKQKKEELIKLSSGNQKFNVKDVILGGGEFGHTSSFFFRKKIIKNPPEWFITYPSGDTPLRLLSAYVGEIYYLDEVMSVYRRGVKGSWTNRVKNDEDYILHWRKGIKMFKEYNMYTNYEYSREINKRISQIAYRILIRLESLDDNETEEYYFYLTIRNKIKYNLRVKYPQMFNMLKGLKRG